MLTFTHVFAEPNSNSIVDAINPATGRSACLDQTLEQVQERYPLAQMTTWEDWSAAKAARQLTPIVWTPSTRKQYDDMLGCLPPQAMRRGAFLVGEPSDHIATTGEATYQAYRQIGDTYEASSRAITMREFAAATR